MNRDRGGGAAAAGGLGGGAGAAAGAGAGAAGAGGMNPAALEALMNNPQMAAIRQVSPHLGSSMTSNRGEITPADH